MTDQGLCEIAFDRDSQVSLDHPHPSYYLSMVTPSSLSLDPRILAFSLNPTSLIWGTMDARDFLEPILTILEDSIFHPTKLAASSIQESEA